MTLWKPQLCVLFFLLETKLMFLLFGWPIVYLTVERADRLSGLVGYPLNMASKLQMHEGVKAYISCKEMHNH